MYWLLTTITPDKWVSLQSWLFSTWVPGWPGPATTQLSTWPGPVRREEGGGNITQRGLLLQQCYSVTPPPPPSRHSWNWILAITWRYFYSQPDNQFSEEDTGSVKHSTNKHREREREIRRLFCPWHGAGPEITRKQCFSFSTWPTLQLKQTLISPLKIWGEDHFQPSCKTNFPL